MCMCIYMYVCVYTYTHTYMHTNTHTRVYFYLFIFLLWYDALGWKHYTDQSKLSIDASWCANNFSFSRIVQIAVGLLAH